MTRRPDPGAYHTPVLVDEVMKHLLAGGPRADAAEAPYLDATVGGGGHAEALLQRCPHCRLVALDKDPEAVEACRTRLAPYADRVRLVRMPFEDVGADVLLRAAGLAGALMDLGASSRQLDSDERGFTFRRHAPLDARMDPLAGPTAADFLAQADRRELADALRAGQAPRPGALAARIVQRRRTRPLDTADDLVAVLESVLSRRSTHAEKARLFQAVRIRVNRELEALRGALPVIRDLLRPGAALVVIAYHSGEDRVTKRAFRRWSDPAGELPPRLPLREAEMQRLGTTITPRPVTALPAEVDANSRARPARLRAWRKAA